MTNEELQLWCSNPVTRSSLTHQISELHAPHRNSCIDNFVVEQQIRSMVYHLRLPLWMKQLHPVFNVVKLTLALNDLITGWKMEDHPLPVIIDGEAEWEVEEILDSHWYWRRFQYLIKWKGYSRKHNSWESTSKVSAPELTVEFHRKLSQTSFGHISINSSSILTVSMAMESP